MDCPTGVAVVPITSTKFLYPGCYPIRRQISLGMAWEGRRWLLIGGCPILVAGVETELCKFTKSFSQLLSSALQAA
ncbi:MAG: hypothetical protein ACI89E_000728 [Planctomycetota bacterium]|jgi:hypothetical protein